MPLLATLIFVVLLTLFLTSLLAFPFGWRHGRSRDDVFASWLFAILVLLPLVWAAAIWLPPAGPAIAGVNWVGPLLVGLLIALLLAALAPPRLRPLSATPPTGAATAPGDRTIAAREDRVFADLMFWVFLALAVGLVITGYVT